MCNFGTHKHFIKKEKGFRSFISTLDCKMAFCEILSSCSDCLGSTFSRRKKGDIIVFRKKISLFDHSKYLSHVINVIPLNLTLGGGLCLEKKRHITSEIDCDTVTISHKFTPDNFSNLCELALNGKKSCF